MIQSVAALVGLLQHCLRDEVLPHLSTDHAQAQVAGILDVLTKLGAMATWSADGLRERLACLEDGATAFAGRAAAAGLQPPTRPERPDLLLGQGELQGAVEAAECHLCALSDWLFASDAALADPLRGELDALLRRTLRTALLAERKQMPRADFAAMTASRTLEPKE